ncbi:BUD22 family protein [Aspergillus lucknowensis]|uniref:Bud-site selection protein n=1 Tax=Aspergillus lucknowensis TaxID=176173 RepID=A0ABR4M0F1_9EURO
MPKRKLSDLTDASSQPGNLKLQKTRLKQKFEYGVTTLSGALKTARGFERQKLSRRQKSAKTQGGEGAGTLKRIEGEITVLKTLNLTATAEKYLFKQLVKTKRIAEAPVFVRFKQSRNISIEGPKSTEEANVTARLFKSNPVQRVLPGILDGLKALIGVERAEGKKEKTVKKESRAAEEDIRGKSGELARRRGSDMTDEESEAEPQAGRDLDMEIAGSEEDDYAHFDARLASDSEDNDDSGSDEEVLTKLKSLPLRRDMSISLSPSASPEPEPEPMLEFPPQKKQKALMKASTTVPTSTTFLPSLMMGGYWSGSESEPEEVEETPRRKNRMGQQARRALWEKKYGAAANHVKEQKKKGKHNRDSGWDPRKGATGDGDGGRRKYGTGSNTTAMGVDKRGQHPQRGSTAGKKPHDDKPLHPSWEAARKAKEQKTTAAFQGKKVVFD